MRFGRNFVEWDDPPAWVFTSSPAALWVMPDPEPEPCCCELDPFDWRGPYWDAAVLDEVWRAHGQRLIEAGWTITTDIYRAYKEAGE